MCVPVDAELPDIGLPFLAGPGERVTLTSADGARSRRTALMRPSRRAPASWCSQTSAGCSRSTSGSPRRSPPAGTTLWRSTTSGEPPGWSRETLTGSTCRTSRGRTGADPRRRGRCGRAAAPRARRIRVMTVGFCMGGAFSLRQGLAGHGLAGVVSFYGTANAWRGKLEPIYDGLEFEGKVLGLYGGADKGIPVADVERFDQALADGGVDHEITSTRCAAQLLRPRVRGLGRRVPRRLASGDGVRRRLGGDRRRKRGLQPARTAVTAAATISGSAQKRLSRFAVRPVEDYLVEPPGLGPCHTIREGRDRRHRPIGSVAEQHRPGRAWLGSRPTRSQAASTPRRLQTKTSQNASPPRPTFAGPPYVVQPSACCGHHGEAARPWAATTRGGAVVPAAKGAVSTPEAATWVPTQSGVAGPQRPHTTDDLRRNAR